MIRRSGAFDEEYYRSQLTNPAAVQDVVSHYFEFGERLGLRPNPEFDPLYYVGRNPDVRNQVQNYFQHYLTNGLKEGRRGIASSALALPSNWEHGTQEVVLLLVHELSRTGAPILGWNIVDALKRRGRRVVVVALGEGELREDFAAKADYLLEIPNDGGDEGRKLAVAIAERFKPAYAVCNSAVTAPFGHHLEGAGVPVVGLIHEFGTFIRHVPKMEEALTLWSAVVFPAELIRASVAQTFPVLRLRSTHVLPQGKSVIPARSASASQPLPLRHLREGCDFLVLGAGSFDTRKGIDLFVAAAATSARKEANLRIKFLWVGGRRSDAPEYREYLREQIARSHVESLVEFFDSTEHLEAVYRTVDVMFLSSRLDPLPNVSIDAAALGVPVVCFENASGMADIMEADPICKRLVVPYADSSAAADAILGLAKDKIWRDQAGEAILELARRTFDMQGYVRRIDEIGTALRAQPALKQAAE